MSSPIKYFSQYSAFLAGKTSLQNKAGTYQACEGRLIPGLKLFRFSRIRAIVFISLSNL